VQDLPTIKKKYLKDRIYKMRITLQWMELASSCCHANDDVSEASDVIDSRATSYILFV